MDLEAYFYINSYFFAKNVLVLKTLLIFAQKMYISLVRDIQISIYKRRKQSIVNQLITITKKRFSP